jgi:predicted nucleic acid-binding protein
MEKKSVYIETSIVSYLTAKPTNDLLGAAWQKATIDWWDTQRDRFEIFTSDVTLEEAGRGDAEAAARRLESLADIPILPISESVVTFARALLRKDALPAKALDDSLHIAVSAVHGVDYLLTWNFRHLDNAETKPIVRSVCSIYGYTSPEICTPQELMGVIDDA